MKINRSKGGRIAGFMPAVWYSKEASEAEEQGSKEEVDSVPESAKILKGDHIITAQETFKKGQLQKRRYILETLLHDKKSSILCLLHFSNCFFFSVLYQNKFKDFAFN